jgi:hypothetical protein
MRARCLGVLSPQAPHNETYTYIAQKNEEGRLNLYAHTGRGPALLRPTCSIPSSHGVRKRERVRDDLESLEKVFLESDLESSPP